MKKTNYEEILKQRLKRHETNEREGAWRQRNERHETNEIGNNGGLNQEEIRSEANP